MAGFLPKDYVSVRERIQEFWKKYPDGAIITEKTIVSDNVVDFKTFIYKTQEERFKHCYSATGHARGYIKTDKNLEKAESVSVGRALGIAGFKIQGGIATKEEMEKVSVRKNKATKNTPF